MLEQEKPLVLEHAFCSCSECKGGNVGEKKLKSIADIRVMKHNKKAYIHPTFNTQSGHEVTSKDLGQMIRYMKAVKKELESLN